MTQNNFEEDPMTGKRVVEHGYANDITISAIEPDDSEESNEKEVSPENITETENTNSNIAPPVETEENESNDIGKNYDGDGVTKADFTKDENEDNEEPDDDDGEKNIIEIAMENKGMFSEMLVGAFSENAPKLFILGSNRLSGVRTNDIYHLTHVTQLMPKRLFNDHIKDQNELYKALKLRKSETEKLTEYLKAWIKSKNPKAESPGNALLGQIVAIAARMGQEAYVASIRSKERWDAIFDEFGIDKKRKTKISA